MEDYYGWRARLGLIYMASSTVMEPEFAAMCPPGVSFHTSRIHLPAPTVAGLDRMMAGDEVERCTRELASAPLHAIVFGGTSATFLHGLGWDREVCKRIAAASGGMAATTTSTASLKALRACGATRIVLATPYVDEVTARGRAFFEANGLNVLHAAGMGLDEDHAIGTVSTEQVYEFVRNAAVPDADAVFISCTNLRTIGAIAPLEEDLGMPVVSAIQASFWDVLRLAGCGAKVHGFGRLLTL
ncbi:maleate cis-trans isomerase family protein [Rhodoligotrophos defluvii]|uniref:maleate cis-trans isomerase family protein n=1 Tax=Rhodoligotrophos defluvii TaxID=2561934 RepID=UPI0010C954DE|nr:Asp/Glu racemase [Rhodoligotrophos defluvii]